MENEDQPLPSPAGKNLLSAPVIGIDEIVSILLERAWVVVVCVLAALLIGFAYLERSTKIYSTTVVLEVKRFNIVNMQGADSESLRNTSKANTMLALLSSQPILQMVADDLNLGANPEFTGGKTIPNTIAAARLASRVNGRVRPSTYLIDLSVEHPNPKLAALIANSLARSFIQKRYEDKSGASSTAAQDLEMQAERLRAKIFQKEQKLQEFRENARVASLDSVDLRNLNNRINEVRKERLRLEADMEEMRKIGNNPDQLIGLQSVRNDPSVSNLVQSMAQQQELIASLSQRLTSGHPRMLKASAELRALKRTLDDQVIAATQKVKPRYDAQYAQEKSIEKMVMKRNREATEYQRLERELQENRDVYNILVARLKEMEINKEIEPDEVAIVQNAPVPGAPIKPDRNKTMLMAGAGGFVLGILIAFGLHALDTSLKSPDQVENLTGFPALTVISEARSAIGKRRSTRQGPSGISPAVRESFRSLVVALKLLGRKRDGRVFLFTSPLPAEGKTFCSYHTAIQLATQGNRTLLIDSDLRKPFLHNLVEKSTLSPGLSDLLAGELPISEVVLQTMQPNLDFIAAGTRAPNPPKLLNSSAFADMIESVRDHYDYIIMDSAPVNAVADTLLLSQYVQNVVMIVRAGSTPERALRRALQSLTGTAKRDPCGIVLNRYKRRRGLYYYYNYSYHKSYGEYGAYGADQDRTAASKKKRSRAKA